MSVWSEERKKEETETNNDNTHSLIQTNTYTLMCPSCKTLIEIKVSTETKLFLVEKTKLTGAALALKGMLEQWDIHTDLDWRTRAIAYAKKYPDLEYAKLLIAKEKACDIISQEGKGEP